MLVQKSRANTWQATGQACLRPTYALCSSLPRPFYALKTPVHCHIVRTLCGHGLLEVPDPLGQQWKILLLCSCGTVPVPPKVDLDLKMDVGAGC